MILHCNFEELNALREGARIVLHGVGGEGAAPVVAPPAGRVHVEELLPRLDGDLAIETLSEQRAIAVALSTIVDVLRAGMESEILAQHPGGEEAVTAYFEFGYALAVLHRVEEMGSEMEAVIELVTGQEATEDVARTFVFPN